MQFRAKTVGFPFFLLIVASAMIENSVANNDVTSVTGAFDLVGDEVTYDPVMNVPLYPNAKAKGKWRALEQIGSLPHEKMAVCIEGRRLGAYDFARTDANRGCVLENNDREFYAIRPPGSGGPEWMFCDSKVDKCLHSRQAGWVGENVPALVTVGDGADPVPYDQAKNLMGAKFVVRWPGSEGTPGAVIGGDIPAGQEVWICRNQDGNSCLAMKQRIPTEEVPDRLVFVSPSGNVPAFRMGFEFDDMYADVAGYWSEFTQVLPGGNTVIQFKEGTSKNQSYQEESSWEIAVTTSAEMGGKILGIGVTGSLSYEDRKTFTQTVSSSWARDEEVSVTKDVGESGVVVWQWVSRIRDSRGNELLAKTDKVAVTRCGGGTNGQQPQCFPNKFRYQDDDGNDIFDGQECLKGWYLPGLSKDTATECIYGFQSSMNVTSESTGGTEEGIGGGATRYLRGF